MPRRDFIRNYSLDKNGPKMYILGYEQFITDFITL